MSNDAYLRGLLAQQDLTPEEWSALQRFRDTIEGQLRSGLNKIARVYYAGSFGKDTMIRELYDLDIVVYWANECGFTLQNIYNAVGDALKKNWKFVKSKTVAWELPFQGGFHVDVVPGRALDGTFTYANLFRTDTGTSLQTSIKVHIDTVKRSGRRDAIRLMKLWRKRKGVPFNKSLALELITIDGCSGLPVDNLEKQMLAAFRYMADNILTTRLVDPANTNNVISDEITSAEKLAIQSAAKAAIAAQYWSQVF